MSDKYRHYKNITRKILDKIKVGNMIKINNWTAPMTVIAVSQNYFLMISKKNNETYYSVCSKIPWNGIRYNNMVGGMFHCGRDDWVFGSPLCIDYKGVYEFKDPKVTAKYLQEFENGITYISKRNGVAIYDLYIK